MSRIVVLGDLNLDVHAIDPADASPGDEIRASVRAVPGGSAGTFARTAAGVGASVLFIGCVGNDLVGDLLVRSLEERDIESAVGRVALPSGTILALQQGEERTMVCSRGANDGLSVEMVDAVDFSCVDHLHVSGYAFLSSRQCPAALHAIKLAGTYGATISVDPPPASLIEAHGRASFLTYLDRVAWIFPNHAEGRVLTGRSEPEGIVDELADRFSSGALTLGVKGALAWDGASRDAAAPPAAHAGNTTGAGDAFAAGFTVARLEGASLAEANARACELAADHVQRNGRETASG